MLMAVKNQFKVSFLSIKYSLMREMLNKVSFVSNVLFMILNNASFLIQWVVLFALKDNFGGYSFRQILVLWGMASGVYGIAHFFFEKAFSLSDTINSGKLDAYIVQPKNILLSVVTSNISVSALGDILFAVIMYVVYGFTIKGFLLFITFCITGGLIMASLAVILNSLAFWLNNSEMIADMGVSLMVNFATYPDGIFKGLTKILLFTIIPVGISNYIPVKVVTNFNMNLFIINLLVCILFVTVAFIVFYRGLKRYSSSNLMSARI